jgi:hypothetical protein
MPRYGQYARCKDHRNKYFKLFTFRYIKNKQHEKNSLIEEFKKSNEIKDIIIEDSKAEYERQIAFIQSQNEDITAKLQDAEQELIEKENALAALPDSNQNYEIESQLYSLQNEIQLNKNVISTYKNDITKIETVIICFYVR